MNCGNGDAPGRQHDGEPGDIAELQTQMAAMSRGAGAPQALITAVRGAPLLLALLAPEQLWTCELEETQWLFAFTTTGELHAFLQQKWDASQPGDLPPELAQRAVYLRINGAELLNDLIPALMERDRLPYGVALDVASPQRTFLPPLPGIVPEHAALDLDAATGTEGTAA